MGRTDRAPAGSTPVTPEGGGSVTTFGNHAPAMRWWRSALVAEAATSATPVR